MSIVFNINEILEIAKQIERNGAAFYRKAAKYNKSASKLLLEIAEQEDEHLRIFTEMQKELSGQELEPTAFDPEGQAELYLKALANKQVFDVDKDPSKTLTGKESINEIFLMAQQAEKDSIVFYVSMREMVPQKLGGEKLNKIIHEEVKHIFWLANKQKELSR
jgi:rubrerythrin